MSGAPKSKNDLNIKEEEVAYATTFERIKSKWESDIAHTAIISKQADKFEAESATFFSGSEHLISQKIADKIAGYDSTKVSWKAGYKIAGFFQSLFNFKYTREFYGRGLAKQFLGGSITKEQLLKAAGNNQEVLKGINTILDQNPNDLKRGRAIQIDKTYSSQAESVTTSEERSLTRSSFSDLEERPEKSACFPVRREVTNPSVKRKVDENAGIEPIVPRQNSTAGKASVTEPSSVIEPVKSTTFVRRLNNLWMIVSGQEYEEKAKQHFGKAAEHLQEGRQLLESTRAPLQNAQRRVKDIRGKMSGNSGSSTSPIKEKNLTLPPTSQNLL